VAERIEQYCRARQLVDEARRSAEEHLRLVALFAGHSVLATPSENGLIIHAIDLDDPDEIHRQRAQLRSQGHDQVFSLYPSAWADEFGLCTANPTA
jgi:hypothetical protein